MTDVEARFEHLKKQRCCFNCLKPGHSKRDCRTEIKCYRCKARGNHHIALCMKDRKEQKDAGSYVTSDNQSVLLQTANAYLADEKEEKLVDAKFLFDSCSQQTYITEKVAKVLKLKSIRDVKMSIKAFGNNVGKVM